MASVIRTVPMATTMPMAMPGGLGSMPVFPQGMVGQAMQTVQPTVASVGHVQLPGHVQSFASAPQHNNRTADERAFVVNSYQERVVHLNVGGLKYQSTYETLSHSAVFAALLRMKADKEEIFIDRDGVPFKWILSFLRSISVGLFSRQWAMSMLEHLPYVDKLAIMEEAEFFQIPQLMSLVTK